MVNFIPKLDNFSLPAEIRKALNKLPNQKQKEFVKEFNKDKKSISVAYFLWIFFWGNYAYLKKWNVQILLWLAIVAILAWRLIDLFRIPKMVRRQNKRIAIDVLKRLKVKVLSE